MNIRHRCRLGANSMVVPTDAPEYTHTCELIAQRGRPLVPIGIGTFLAMVWRTCHRAWRPIALPLVFAVGAMPQPVSPGQPANMRREDGMWFR
jgi:hypothetical protein